MFRLIFSRHYANVVGQFFFRWPRHVISNERMLQIIIDCLSQQNRHGPQHTYETYDLKKKEEQKKNENSIRRVFNFIVHSENGMNAENGHGQSHGQQHYHDSSNIRNQITGNTEPYRLQHRTQQTHTLTLTHTHDELQKRK